MPRRRGLTRTQVVEGALAIVDQGGVEELSMPRLARHLGVGVMTLYGYVDSKAELLDALAQEVLRKVSPPDPGVHDWRAALAAHARQLRSVLVAHPGLGDLFARQGLTVPAVFDLLEASLGILLAGGLDERAAVRTYYAVLTYTLGFASWELPRVHRQPESDYRGAWARVLAQLDAETHPALQRTRRELPTSASREQFEFGLQALLAGVVVEPRPASHD